MITKKEEREPTFTWCGQFVMLCRYDNVVGDTAWDCDYGDLKWNGTEWKQYNPK